MQRLLAVAWVALLGCGGPLPLATSYAPRSGQPLAPNPPEVPASTPNFVIDGGVGANIPFGAYGITTNGSTWYLEWQNDDMPHRLSGDIYCPASCQQSFVTVSGYGTGASPGYTIVAKNHFHFDTTSVPRRLQQIEFDATQQPILFSLSIDGQPATNPATTFSSQQQLATIDVMPFGLVSSNISADMF